MNRTVTVEHEIEHEIENGFLVFDVTITATTDGMVFWDTEVIAPFGEIPFTRLSKHDRDNIAYEIYEAYANYEPDYEL